MRILALVTDAFGGTGGIACYNRALFAALARDRRVSAIRVLPRVGAGRPGIDRIEQLAPRPGKVSYSVAAVREARRLRPDWIFCGHLYMLPLATLVGRLIGAPVWLQLHGIDAWQATSALARRRAECTDFVTCVSRHTRRRFLSWAAIDPARVRILPNTVGSEFVVGDREHDRHALGLAGRVVLLSVGRLAAQERYKGQDRVLECLPGLRRAFPDLLYVIAGSGPDRARLERIAQRVGVADAVRFIGEVGASELPRWYGAADLFVLPSTGEGFGIVFVGSSRVDLQACKLEYSIVSPK